MDAAPPDGRYAEAPHPLDEWRPHMATYIMLGRFTDQGVRNAKETLKRAEAAREIARKLGATVKQQFWTLGKYDIALTLDAPDEATATAFSLGVAALGNIHTHTLRAFESDEMGKILGRIA
jgi:uncharacterized protein with GYD domain